MSTTTYTVAQALTNTGLTGIHVVDSASNIAAALPNASLVSRVTLFSLSGNGTVTALQAAALATLGAAFSTNSHTLTVRDTVANLIAPANAAGLGITGIVVTVADTAANILAATSSIITHASAIALTASATLTLQQLITLESWASFTAVGVTLTLQDTAANLLAFTAAEAKPALTIFHLSASGTVTAAQALTLQGLAHFAINTGATLTIADTISNISGSTTALATLLASSSVAVDFTDSLSNLLAQAATFAWSKYPGASVTLSGSAQTTVANLVTLAALPHFGVASGTALTIGDTVRDIVTLTGVQAALATAIHLTANDTATAAQLAVLASFSNFAPGAGNTLTVDDTLANLATLTVAQHALAGAETIDDTVTDLLSAQAAYASVLAGASRIVAELDGTTLTAAQAVTLAALAGHTTLTLHANGTASTLTISDTSADLAVAASSIAILEADGPVTVIPQTNTDRSILTASAAAALVTSGVNPATETLAVADSGSAVTQYAAQIFGQGFQTITITAGSFDGTLAQLLDSTLHFAAGTTAQLDTNATATAAQAVALAALPGFSRGNGITLLVQDSISDILAAAGTLAAIATGVQATDSETVTVAGAETLAALPAFSLHGSVVNIQDTAANLAGASAAATALAFSLSLTSDARISAAVATQFAALGTAFSNNGFFVTIADTASNLAALAATPATLAAINDWVGEAVLSADATTTVATAASLTQLSGFNAGIHHLTVADSAADLLAANATVLAVAYAVQLSQASTVTAAGAATLEAMPHFSAAGYLTIADTPMALAAMAPALAAAASNVTLVAETGGNAAAYALGAAQFAALMALHGISLAGFAGTIVVSDSAAALSGITGSVSGLPANITSHIDMMLNAAATVSVSEAEALAQLPDFSRNGYTLMISDTAANIATLNAAALAIASGTDIIGGNAALSVATFTTVIGTANFTGRAGEFAIADTAAHLLTLVGNPGLSYVGSVTVQAGSAIPVASAEQLLTLPNLQFAGNLALIDAIGNLLPVSDDGTTPAIWTTIVSQAASVTLNAAAPAVNAAQALLLAQLGARFSDGGYQVTISDTAPELLTLINQLGPIASQLHAVTLSNATTTVSGLATMAELRTLPVFTGSTLAFSITDTVSDLTASANAALLSALTASFPNITFTLSGADSASVAQAMDLQALGSHFSRGSNALVIADTAADLATLSATAASLASAVQLQDHALVSAANYALLSVLPNFTTNGNTLVITDTVADLLPLLSGTNLSFASAVTLSAAAIGISAATAEQLASLPNFSAGAVPLTISDSAADLTAGSGAQPNDWAGELAARAVVLSSSGAAITAAQAEDLEELGSRFSTGGFVLSVSDTAANLLASANAGGLSLATAVSLSNNETLTSANWSWLNTLANFSKGGNVVTISDTAAAMAAANPALLGRADHVQLSTAATLTVAAAEALIGLANYRTAAAVTIADTLPDLLTLASAGLANNASILAATPIALSADATATAAQLTALEQLAQYASFSLDNHAITLADSGRNLASFAASGAAIPANYIMMGDATLSAAAALVLANENVDLNGNALTVADTPANLTTLSPAVSAIATTLSLSGAATATVSQIDALVADARFTTGGHALTVTGSAAGLLSLSAATQSLATTLALSAPDTVDAAQLVQLTELGNRFSPAGHALTVSDTAANLAALNTLETALVTGAVLDATPASAIDTATATALAALPDFSLGNSVSLTVEGSYSQLEALPALMLSIATLEISGGAATLGAAAAATIASTLDVTPLAGVVVQDTLANLAGNPGWQPIATAGYIVADTAADLIANPSSPLLSASASGLISVTLTANAEVSAAEFATLAGIAHFARGTAALTVADTAAAIANNASAIASLASTALVNAAAPVTVAEAAALAVLNTDSKLTFAGGISLAIKDSFADITAALGSAGLQLASSVTVFDTAQNLLSAAVYGWGSLQPYYQLQTSATVLAANAATLYGLGSHFLAGATLSVQDTAANVVADAAAIAGLGIGATVQDSLSAVDAHVAALAALGSTLAAITLTDGGPVLAAPAAGISSLAGKLTGPLAVSDTAAAIDGNIAGLQALGAHLASVTVADSAADLAPYAAAIASAFGSALHLDLSDASPIALAAAAAAELAPVEALLAGLGFTVTVSDTDTAIVANATGLADLGSVLGTLTLGSTATDAATAAAIAPLAAHLAGGVTLAVTDTAAAIGTYASALTTLHNEGRLASVTATAQTAATVAAAASTLAALDATATVSDSAAQVSAALDTLQTLLTEGILTAISLTDSGTPDITLSLAQLTRDAGVLALIGSAFRYAISDTSPDIAGDLGAGINSHLISLGAALNNIAVTGGTLTLTAATLRASGVDDSVAAPLTKLVPDTSIVVTNAAVADLAPIDALQVAPASIQIADSGSDIAADLELGGSSALVAHRALISTIAASGSISIDAATDARSHVNDGAGSVLSLVASPVLIVTGVAVSSIAGVLSPAAGIVAASSITVSDTAADIQTDLGSASPVLVQYRTAITSIAAGSGTISLDATHALAAGVDNGPGSVFAMLTGATLAVTGALVAQLPALAGLTVVPASVSVSDTAADIQADLTSGANLATYAGDGLVTAIASTTGAVSLAYTALTAPVVTALAKLAADSLDVSNVPVSAIDTVAAMPAFAAMTVQDSGANLAAALAPGGALALQHAAIAGVTVSDTFVILTDTAAKAADANAIALLPAGSLDVTGVPVADLPTITALAPIAAVAVSDTAANLAADLQLGASSKLVLDAAKIGSIAMSDNGSIALTDAQADADAAILSKLPAACLTISGVTLADLPTLAGAGAVQSLTVQDNGVTLATDLAKIAASQTSVLQTWLSKISGITATGQTASLTGTQAVAALAELEKFTAATLSITAVPVSDAATIATLGAALAAMTVSDTAGAVTANLGTLQALVNQGVPLAIDLTNASNNTDAITLTAGNYTLYESALDRIAGVTAVVQVSDGAAAVAAIAGTLASDPIVGEVDVSDSTANILANLTTLESIGSKFKQVTVTDHNLNASEVAALMTIPNLTTGSLVITDTGSQIAAAIEANGAAGVTFLNNQTVELSANSVIAASDAAALEQLTSLQTNDFVLVVWDTASHLTDTIDKYLTAVQQPLISAVYLKTTGGTATITAATAAALLTIPTFSKDNPPVAVGGPGGTNVVTLVDTAAHIDAQYSALLGHTSELSGIQVSASATVTDTTFGDLLALGATMASGQVLTVRDLPATILADAPAQLASNPAIVPTAWQLTGSDTVTEAQAAWLGALPSINAGANTLTLSGTGAQIAISVQDAIDLGNLGSAFHLNGNQLIVNTDVSAALTLTTSAKAIVTTNITDTFAQIAQLTAGDGLLNGVVTVTDSSTTATVAETSSVLGLIGVAGGIAASNLHFNGNIETVTDTYADLQPLLASTAWTGNTGFHADFHLVVADTVADLLAVSASTLATLYGTTLSGNQTGISAANAETLASEATTINFTVGSYSITIQDTAANLLNPANSDGEALAAVWQLSGNNTVSAAGAETLLPETQFHLNHVLTVSDTSADLLDGLLSNVVQAANAVDASYGGSVQVTLSDAETLDANTAEALVSLPGFQNTGELSIADASSYLLNASNATAENDATSVTLAGNETVSVATAAKLAAVAHFVLDGNVLSLASNDYANASQLAALGGFGSGFQTAGHTVTLTQDALDLTPAQYNALQSDNVLLNGHLWSAATAGVSVSESSGTATIGGTGVSGAAVTLYNASGAVVTSGAVSSGSFTVTASDSGVNFAVTETVGGIESAPSILLQDTILTAKATADGVTFATSGQVQIAANEYMTLYTAGSQPGTIVNPILVYDPNAHTLSYEDSHATVVLVTLGTTTHPASLDPSEIIIKHA